jgi:ureidoacrylate peracid hydrolase
MNSAVMSHAATYGIDPMIIERMRVRRGRLHAFERIDPNKTALVVIDMQRAFLEPGAPSETPAARDCVPHINRLAAAVRASGGVVAWVQAVFKRGDWSVLFDNMFTPQLSNSVLEALLEGAPLQQLWPALDIAPTDLTATKSRYSAFFPGASDLPERLRLRGIDTVLITGTLTNVCCESSARDAMMDNFKVIMVADANGARSPLEHIGTLTTIVQTFGDVRNTDEVIELLHGR